MVSNLRFGVGAGVLCGMALALFAFVALAGAAGVDAETAGVCQDEFNVLRMDTQSVSITGGKVDRERAGLLKLVDDAEALAAGGKTADAVTKLGNFTVKVDQLEAAGRISAESANSLRSDVEATIACLQGSSAST